MREPIVALRVPADTDLSPLTNVLWRDQIPHRVVADERMQLLLVLDVETARRVQQLAQLVAAGAPGAVAPLALPGTQFLRDGALGLWQALRSTPCTAAVIVLAVLLAPVAMTGKPAALLSMLFILPAEGLLPQQVGHAFEQVLLHGEFWRLLTPCLLHFSLLHLLMDVYLFWEFSRRIETVFGTFATLLLFVIIGGGSNLAQLWIQQSPLFGGLSGLVTGLLGVVLVLARRGGDARLRVPPALSIGTLVSVLLLSTGAAELFGVHVANTAHWAGLGLGALIGVLWPLRGAAHDANSDMR